MVWCTTVELQYIAPIFRRLSQMISAHAQNAIIVPCNKFKRTCYCPFNFFNLRPFLPQVLQLKCINSLACHVTAMVLRFREGVTPAVSGLAVQCLHSSLWFLSSSKAVRKGEIVNNNSQTDTNADSHIIGAQEKHISCGIPSSPGCSCKGPRIQRDVTDFAFDFE